MHLKEKVKFAKPSGNNWWKQFTLKGGMPDRIPRGAHSIATYEDDALFFRRVTQIHSPTSSDAPVGKCLRIMRMPCSRLRLWNTVEMSLLKWFVMLPRQLQLRWLGTPLQNLPDSFREKWMLCLKFSVEQCFVFRKMLISFSVSTSLENTNKPISDVVLVARERTILAFY